MKLYRAMTPGDDGQPVVGRSARRLGVRVLGPVRDVVPDGEGMVRPATGGMSVVPDNLWNLPAHRRPRRLGHGSTCHDVDRIFAIEHPRVDGAGLVVRIDAPDRSHALIEPGVVMPLGDYENRLTATRPDWTPDEP